MALFAAFLGTTIIRDCVVPVVTKDHLVVSVVSHTLGRLYAHTR